MSNSKKHSRNRHAGLSAADLEFAASGRRSDIDRMREEMARDLTRLEREQREVANLKADNARYSKNLLRERKPVSDVDWNWLERDWDGYTKTWNRSDWEEFEREFPREEWPSHIDYGNTAKRGKWEREQRERRRRRRD
jgi:hypothetical protein